MISKELATQYINDIRSDSKKATANAIEKLVPEILEMVGKADEIIANLENDAALIGVKLDYFESFNPNLAQFVDITSLVDEETNKTEEFFYFAGTVGDYYYPVTMISDPEGFLKDVEESNKQLINSRADILIQRLQEQIDYHESKAKKYKEDINEFKQLIK